MLSPYVKNFLISKLSAAAAVGASAGGRVDGASATAGAAAFLLDAGFGDVAVQEQIPIGAQVVGAVIQVAARAALGDMGAASAFDGKLVARLMAGDGWPLRQALMRLIRAIRPGPLPRVWQT